MQHLLPCTPVLLQPTASLARIARHGLARRTRVALAAMLEVPVTKARRTTQPTTPLLLLTQISVSQRPAQREALHILSQKDTMLRIQQRTLSPVSDKLAARRAGERDQRQRSPVPLAATLCCQDVSTSPARVRQASFVGFLCLAMRYQHSFQDRRQVCPRVCRLILSKPAPLHSLSNVMRLGSMRLSLATSPAQSAHR